MTLDILHLNKVFISDNYTVESINIKREVKYDAYYASDINFATDSVNLLLVNDGQDLVKMNFLQILEKTDSIAALKPLLVVGIHCGADRIEEYGTADILDFKGRGKKGANYRRFIIEELIPKLQVQYKVKQFTEISYAGFSLGGLSAIDIAWKYPKIFTKVGVFSGALWWRNVALDSGYQEDKNKIMHQLIRHGKYQPHMKFYFEVGRLDETSDRNNNGVIDAIDDTRDMIMELKNKGYSPGKDIEYLELPDGKHDVNTWAKAFPAFLVWGWHKN
ncbi:alpha/beta hydrolase [Polluticaenibacter yanchengensis]|uniref:Alpha/beta hydrolase-fold protein n=1 Tax=Polluticaenibacter yanchengensis TaxID=3014562 RepID=A0ABT4UHL1_9BACT|nr:alpha/beta hydrolase-fold protein [Chitinophagaceae bacterium LY-5]